MSAPSRSPHPVLRLGFLADGIFKLLVAALYVALSSTLADLFAVPGWLLLLTALLVALSAVAEIRYALVDGAGDRTGHLIAYDSSWVLATVLALVLGAGAGGWVWLGFQALASPVLATVFFRRRAAT